MVSSLSPSTEVGFMLSRLSVPLGGKGIVLSYSFSVLIHLSQRVLRVGVSLFCRPPEPIQRGLKVGLSKPSLVIKQRPAASVIRHHHTAPLPEVLFHRL